MTYGCIRMFPVGVTATGSPLSWIFTQRSFSHLTNFSIKKQKVKYLGKKSRFQEDSGTSETRSLIGYQLRAARSFLTGAKFN